MKPLKSYLTRLVEALESLPQVRAIGKSGGADLPNDGFSDIDLFILCSSVPTPAERNALLTSLSEFAVVSSYGAFEHPHWGMVDSLLLGEQEVYLMFFTMDVFQASITAILRGERTQREENYFYPTGRCATLLGMHVFYDPDGIFARLRDMCADYPTALREAIIQLHLPKIDDREDFMRAIRRADVLFYHATLDLAMDHFLQTLFALNRVYFPSRKRSLSHINAFHIKPQNCEERLLKAIELGAKGETLEESYAVWQRLCEELCDLITSSIEYRS